MIGQTVGHYHIVEQLGEGGMAIVYKAFDTRLERDVAVKVILRNRFAESDTALILKRFDREAKSLAKLSHPNIVRVLDYGEHEDSPYLVMEYLPGGTLKKRLGVPMNWAEAARLLLPIAQALDYAHQRKIIHRDVKPANILLTESGQPMLSDFGVAKLLERSSETGTLTGTGVGIGTPEYMAPEQWEGRADHRTDVYALGVVFYEMITGVRPYTADTPAAVLIKQITDPLPRPTQFVPDLPDSVENILFKALEKNPGNRYQSMSEFANVLEKISTATLVTPSTAPQAQQPQPTLFLPTDYPTIAVVPEKKQPSFHVPSWVWITGSAVVVVAVVVIAIIGSLLASNIKLFSTTPSTPATPALALATTIRPASTIAPTTRPPNTPTTKPPTTQAPTVAPTLRIGSTQISKVDGMVQMYVPAGSFKMGTGNDDALNNEGPAHTVTLNAFWIDKTEVTNAMFAKFVQATGYKTDAEKAGKGWADTGKGNWQEVYGAQWRNPHGPSGNINLLDSHPVVQMSWNDANSYCIWAGRRLPTEAEWEKAARGTDGRTYPWGSDKPNGDLLNFADRNSDASWADQSTNDGYKFTAPVGNYIKGASPFGVFDMAGNVWEWVNDWYEAKYYSNSPSQDPTGPSSGKSRVMRGSGWSATVVDLPVSRRSGSAAMLTYDFYGFRCAASP